MSKPVVYEHFGGKEGLYAVVVDREVRSLLDADAAPRSPAGHPRELLEQAALALLDYIEQSSDGFRILVRDCPDRVGVAVVRLDHRRRRLAGGAHPGRRVPRARLRRRAAPMYAQMLVGMVGTTGQWWLDARQPAKDDVAAHLVNLAWHGLPGLEAKPTLRTRL